MRSLLAAVLFSVLSMVLVAAPVPARADAPATNPFAGTWTGVISDSSHNNDPAFDLSVTLKISKRGTIKARDADLVNAPGQYDLDVDASFPYEGSSVMNIHVSYEVGQVETPLSSSQEYVFLDGDTLYLVDTANTDVVAALTRD